MIQWQNDADVFGRLFLLSNDPIFSQLRNTSTNLNADLSDSLSWGQLKSKRWLITELEKLDIDLGTVFICAGWYATLALMLTNSKCKIKKILSIDQDETCVPIADSINSGYVKQNWKFKAITDNIHNINYDQFIWSAWSNVNNRMSYPITDIPNTIINTSCEHIEKFSQWYNKIPKNKLIVLQSNDYFSVNEHINCSKNLEEFKEQTPLTIELYSGQLELEKYTRFMRIGYK